MSRPYVFLNQSIQCSTRLKASLSLGVNARAKFDVLNLHIRNVMVFPGQIVIVGDDSTPSCTAEEAQLMNMARQVNQAIYRNSVGSDGFIVQNYDLLQSVLCNTSLGIGSATGAWGKHLDGVTATLEDIEALHKHSLRNGGTAGHQGFLTQRQQLFQRLDQQLKGFAQHGTGMRGGGSIKKMLGISTKSYLHSGEIKHYANTLDHVAKTAGYMKRGTPIGIALDTTVSALEIKEACSTGREKMCTKAKYVEGSKLVGSVYGGSVGGHAGLGAGIFVCVAVLGVPTGGAGGLACGVIGGGLGGLAGGELGGALGERFGKAIFGAFN